MTDDDARQKRDTGAADADYAQEEKERKKKKRP